MAATHDPEGNPLKLTHRRKATERCYRIVEECVFDFATGAPRYLIANEQGVLFAIPRIKFDADFEYIPGGQ